MGKVVRCPECGHLYQDLDSLEDLRDNDGICLTCNAPIRVADWDRVLGSYDEDAEDFDDLDEEMDEGDVADEDEDGYGPWSEDADDDDIEELDDDDADDDFFEVEDDR